MVKLMILNTLIILKKQLRNLKILITKVKLIIILSLKLSKYDIFLHPSDSENFGLVILEAMSCGLFPVINKKLDWKILDKNNLGCSLNFTDMNLKRLIFRLNKSKQKIRDRKFKKKNNFLIKNYNWNFIIEDYYRNYNKFLLI